MKEINRETLEKAYNILTLIQSAEDDLKLGIIVETHFTDIEQCIGDMGELLDD